MVAFNRFLGPAETRAGGAAALEGMLPRPATAAELIAVTDDRYLSQMSLRIFSAGLRHDMVQKKWPAFESAFHGFDPRRVAAMSEAEIDRCLSDPSLIRHGGKLLAVVANARAVNAVSSDHGSFGRWIAEWPERDIVGLWERLVKDFKQLGGNSGPYFLRTVGKDTFIVTEDVTKALVSAGIVTRKPTGKKDLRTVQDAFNGWMEETGRPLCQLSRILALSVG
ncbi:MAG: 3-methyladenine DNA glycosylase [Rhodospirillaceae bacterium]|nr:3-methyladenine DNA glycosylase [Rhodospirillaceae bacterium]|tara:strand:- start:123 stop:791 length:669 start_codon:yes stop_codon:yes gene_type:complete